jgi:hypothetical protein
MDDMTAASALVQIIDILSNDRQITRSLPLRDRQMSCIWLCLRNQGAAPLIPAPDPTWIAPESLRRRQVLSLKPLPKSDLRIAKGRNAAFS